MYIWTASARTAILGLALCILLTGASSGQRSQMGTNSPTPTSRDQLNPMDPQDKNSAIPGMVERQAKSRNDERQKRLVADTEKLLTLATQLHEDVAKTDRNVLSLDVIRRADEIEKLAHAVKERMKG